MCGVIYVLCVCVYVCFEWWKNNKCVRLVTNFNPFPSYFTAYLVIYMVYEVYVVDMCLFVIIMNTNFLAFWKMKNWQKCFKWIKKDWWANGSSLLKGVAWINFRKNVKQFSFFNLFPISHFLILFLFIYLYLFNIGEWEEEGRRWVDGGCLMEKFTSGTIVIDLYFCIFKETALHSAICAFDLSIDEPYNRVVSIPSLIKGILKLVISQFDTKQREPNTKKKWMYYQKQKIIFSDT